MIHEITCVCVNMKHTRYHGSVCVSHKLTTAIVAVMAEPKVIHCCKWDELTPITSWLYNETGCKCFLGHHCGVTTCKTNRKQVDPSAKSSSQRRRSATDYVIIGALERSRRGVLKNRQMDSDVGLYIYTYIYIERDGLSIYINVYIYVYIYICVYIYTSIYMVRKFYS